MLPSGYLIRPCEGGGSIIHIVDHLNLEVTKYFTASSTPCVEFLVELSVDVVAFLMKSSLSQILSFCFRSSLFSFPGMECP